MCWRLVALLAAGLLALGSAGVASAQDLDTTGKNETTDDSSASVTTEATRQLLGAQLGLEAGGEVSPGGLRIGGSYVYRVSDVDWLDSSVGFTFGSGDPRCFRDRDNDVVCDHGIASGFAAEVTLAVRRHFAVRDGRFEPFARAGLAIRLIGFGDDNVTGLGLPLIGSGGMRARVADKLSVLAMADVRVGWGFYNRGLGAEPHASFALSAGVEFDID